MPFVLSQSFVVSKMLGAVSNRVRPFSALLLGCFASTSVVHASGFALIEQSASGQGLSYAGAAANTENASVMWFNPAGLADGTGHQVILASHVILPKAPFTNEGSSVVNGNTGAETPLFGQTDDGAKTGLVPNLYWKGQLGNYALGLGINVPYGSTVSYDQNWVGRYHAVYTQTKTLNINPAVARKLGKNWLLGAGLNAQWISVNLTQKIDFGTATNAQQNDGYADLSASGWAYGFNLGLLYDAQNWGKVGLGYRSSVAHNAKGQAQFSGPDSIMALSDYAASGIQSKVTLPASLSLSYDVALNPSVHLLADATWMGWSKFQELRIQYDSGRADSVQPEAWQDVMRYALGATYQASSQLKLRTGVALDNTPIKNASLRTPRIADSNRQWFSVGAGYALSPNMQFDLGFSRLLGGQPKIEAKDADTGAHTLKGYFDVNVSIISAQLVWKY